MPELDLTALRDAYREAEARAAALPDGDEWAQAEHEAQLARGAWSDALADSLEPEQEQEIEL
jgi:hypothetical protein